MRKSSEALVTIENLSKAFVPGQSPALKEINATIPKGQIVGLVGPDGAGKTTLIRLMAALLLPSSGHITIGGYDTVKESESIHFLTGYMPQKFGLYEDLTVIQNLNLYADLRGVVQKEREKTFAYLLKFTGLAPFTTRLAGALSGGMKQKLGLACALIKKPALLLLDEPSVGVDPISRRELWKMVYELLKEGISVVWSTAYLDEAEKCDTVLLLNEGKLLYHGNPHKLTERVKDRVFKIAHIPTKRRSLLFEVLKQKNVIDAVIQGKDVRLVMKDPSSTLTSSLLKAEKGLQLEQAAPRFEDAFIDILGGGPGGTSELAQVTPTTRPSSETVIVADSLTKKFGTFTAAEKISFTVKQGEIFGLLGPNGAGKSTTFKMLCGLLKPTEGKAFVNDLDLQVAPGEARAHIGYMAQKFSLYGSLSVMQNLMFFSGIYNLQGNRRKEAVKEMIEIFKLEEYLNVSAETLPLGFKQRLALACANMHHPEVLFLDEPTSGVDPITRREFWNHINGLVEKGVTVMVTTHFMDEAEYCDRIALIYRGQMIHMDTPDALKELAKSSELLNPTLEDAFVKQIEDYDEKNPNK
jgi:ABC-2 type transport system ATP-binding protein